MITYNPNNQLRFGVSEFVKFLVLLLLLVGLNMSTDSKLDILINEIQSLRAEVRSATDKFSTMENKLDSFISKTNEELKCIKEESKTVHGKITTLEASQKFIGNQYDNHKVVMDNIVKSHSKLERENADLNSKIKRLEKNLKEEKDKRNKLEQHGRLEQIEISGIPFKDDESCEDLVIKIAHLAGVVVKPDDISITHRLRGGGIIVQFTTRKMRDRVFNSKKNLKGKTVKDLGLDPPKNNEGKVTPGFIFVNEGLTPENKLLLHQTRKKCRELDITSVWTVKGIIKVKGEHHENIITINNYDDLQKLN